MNVSAEREKRKSDPPKLNPRDAIRAMCVICRRKCSEACPLFPYRLDNVKNFANSLIKLL